MKQLTIILLCFVSVSAFAQTQIDSGQIRRLPIAKLVTPTTPSNGQVIKYNATSGKWEPGTDSGGSVSLPVNRIGFGNGSSIQTDPRILVDSTLKAVVVNGTGTKVSTTSVQPGYIEMRGDTTSDTNVFLKILGGRSSAYTYAPFGLSAEYANAAQAPPYRNYVWTIGPNAAGNSGVSFDATKPSAAKNWETSWLDSSVPRFEIHEHWKHPDSSVIRLNSYTITYPVVPVSGNRLIDVDKYENVDRFYVKHWKQGNSFFSTSWDRSTRLGSHLFQGTQSQSLRIDGYEDSGAADMLIKNPLGTGTAKERSIYFQDWDKIKLNGLNDGWTASTRTWAAYAFNGTRISAIRLNMNSGLANGLFMDNYEFIRSGTSQIDFFGGFQAGPLTGYSGSANIGLGQNAAKGLTSGVGNVVFGDNAGNGITTGVNNVVIGHRALYTLGNVTNKLWIESSNSSTPLLSGDFSTDMLGVNVASAAPNSTWQVNGSTANSILVISGNTTLDATHHTAIIPNGSSFTVTLPSASSITGRIYRIINKTSGSVTIGSYVNLAGSTVTTVATATAIIVQSDGTNWQQIQ